MTGEVTLTGRVLPVGGVREKVLAARRAGITTVLIPRHNEKDLIELPAEVKADVTFHPIDTLDDVVAHLFPARPKPTAATSPSPAGPRPRPRRSPGSPACRPPPASPSPPASRRGGRGRSDGRGGPRWTPIAPTPEPGRPRDPDRRDGGRGLDPEDRPRGRSQPVLPPGVPASLELEDRPRSVALPARRRPPPCWSPGRSDLAPRPPRILPATGRRSPAWRSSSARPSGVALRLGHLRVARLQGFGLHVLDRQLPRRSSCGPGIWSPPPGRPWPSPGPGDPDPGWVDRSGRTLGAIAILLWLTRVDLRGSVDAP